ncbi:MAG: pseudouridine-5'-phosphate glycosidase [Phaeodactylibacter sp.]|nr:pseudouridine-5'-phosphate glycosidase [Phaeodactylibacter sp.]
MATNLLHYAPPVQAAIAQDQPIVALESTIIAHGMPFPKNVDTALEIESLIYAAGAVPATIALMEGKIRIGLSVDEIETIGKGGRRVKKVSRRDMGVVLARKELGATTVAATMIAARLARIHVFATGGIGGVHRGATSTMDISADLQELAQTPVAVISAGAKSILDLGLTLEYLETQGVPVLGYQTKEFPAFFVRKSGFQTDTQVDDPIALAQIANRHWQLPHAGGILIANPIPQAAEPAYQMMDKAIQEAVAEAAAQQIQGKALTPFLLARIEQLTGGESLKANIELVKNNARLAGSLAKALKSL